MALTALALLLPGTSEAAPTWLAAEDLSSVEHADDDPQVAVDLGGNAVAVWKSEVGSEWIVQASARPAGGPWGPAGELSAHAFAISLPQIAVDQAGGAVAVWSQSDGTSWVIHAATRTAGGLWGPAEALSQADPDRPAFRPRIAIDPAGNATVIWERFDGTSYRVESTVRPSGGTWNVAESVSDPGVGAYKPRLALDGTGGAVAVWQAVDGDDGLIQAATRPSSGEGDAVAVWKREGPGESVVQAASRPAGGDWQGAVTLSAAGGDAYEPQIAVDPAGDAVATWSEYAGGGEWIQATGRRDGESWSNPVDLTADAGGNLTEHY